MKLLATMLAAPELEMEALMWLFPRRELGAARESVRARKPKTKASNLVDMVQGAGVVEKVLVDVLEPFIKVKKVKHLGSESGPDWNAGNVTLALLAG
jgi:hypothetical protein